MLDGHQVSNDADSTVLDASTGEEGRNDWRSVPASESAAAMIPSEPPTDEVSKIKHRV